MAKKYLSKEDKKLTWELIKQEGVNMDEELADGKLQPKTENDALTENENP